MDINGSENIILFILSIDSNTSINFFSKKKKLELITMI